MKTRNPAMVKKFQQKLVTRLMKANPAFLADCEFRAVRSALELKMAAHLVYLEYRRMKYSLPNKGQLRMSIHQMVKKSTTLVAIYKGKYIMGTMTLMEDSPLGLPMDKIYSEELNFLRREGRRLVECGMLAMNKKLLDHPALALSQTERMIIMLYMIKAMTHYLRNQTEVDMLVACFHPKHAFFYEGIMLTPLAGLKKYETVQDSPAVAYKWDMRELEKTASSPMQHFFGFGSPKKQPHPHDRPKRLNTKDFGEMFLNSR
jgi:hypothetical protein